MFLFFVFYLFKDLIKIYSSGVSISKNSNLLGKSTKEIRGEFLITSFPPTSPERFSNSLFFSFGKNTGENLSPSALGIVIYLYFRKLKYIFKRVSLVKSG